MVAHTCEKLIQGNPLILFPNTFHSVFIATVRSTRSVKLIKARFSPAEFMSTLAYPSLSPHEVEGRFHGLVERAIEHAVRDVVLCSDPILLEGGVTERV